MMRTLSVLLCLMLLVISFGFSALGGPPKPVPDPMFSPGSPAPGICIDGDVVRVIDGDTIVVRSTVEYHVRLLDCWAPESRTKNLNAKARGLKSKARMQALAEEQSVRVWSPAHADVTQMVTMGRILGRVWIRNGDEVAPSDLSSIMVSEGLATTEKQKPGKEQK